ncbi:MAG: hypothetical protein AABY10_01850 [Nanoarchaeota archaeon]
MAHVTSSEYSERISQPADRARSYVVSSLHTEEPPTRGLRRGFGELPERFYARSIVQKPSNQIEDKRKL